MAYGNGLGGFQTISPKGVSNAGQGQPTGPRFSRGMGRYEEQGFNLDPFSGHFNLDPTHKEKNWIGAETENPDYKIWLERQNQIEQQKQQQVLQGQQRQAEVAGSANEARIQQEMGAARPVQNYVDTWQWTPEKVAAYRAAKQGGTSMQQQPQGMSGGQVSGQQAIANLLRMMGLM